MLTIFIRAIILFAVLLIVIRLMGKRQIGEMEPFELAITLVIAELACIPMADKSIPLSYGVISILTMYLLHKAILLLTKNTNVQKLVSGKPIVIIDTNGINYKALQQLNMTTGDILQAMRSGGYFSIEDVKYGIFETNGQLSILPKHSEDNCVKELPIALILDGAWSEDDLKEFSIDKAVIESIISDYNILLKNILLLTVDKTGKIFLQPKNKKYLIHQTKEKVTR